MRRFGAARRFCSSPPTISILDLLLKQARERPRHIVLPEGRDSRIVQAATLAAQRGIARVTLILPGAHESCTAPVTDEELALRATATAAGVRFLRNDDFVPVHTTYDRDLDRAHVMVADGTADGTVAGAVNTSGDVARAAIKHFRKPGVPLSSFFIMTKESCPSQPTLLFADCSVLVDPTPDQLVHITLESITSFQMLFGRDPKVALLSFSTRGSADSPSVSKVTKALEILRSDHPKASQLVDGEFQADVAVSPIAAQHKRAGGTVAGHADVLVFPNLDAGNIGYKLVERLGGFTAVGPIYQGLQKPGSDLSRGCSVYDVLYAIAITSLQAR